MRDNSEGMVEIVRSYQLAGVWHGLVRVTIQGETRLLDWPLSPAARTGFARVLNLRPFDQLPGLPHRFYFALSRPEVEKLVHDSTAIAMQARDALALERSRGYADIEPELAWEQWQIVRRTI
jgi:hypothetical protein